MSRRGFTLIELMITVAIISVLAVVAYPSFMDSVLKGRRAEGRTALTELLQQQERFVTQTGSYSALDENSTAADLQFKNYSGDRRADASYRLGARDCDGAGPLTLRDCVQVYALPNHADAAVNELRLTSSGVRGCTGTKPARCWK